MDRYEYEVTQELWWEEQDQNEDWINEQTRRSEHSRERIQDRRPKVNEFREEHQDWGIVTEIVEANSDFVIIKAMITAPSGFVVGSGYAEEQRTASQINRTSALENCETSAIGRALAACGYGGTEYASANEVQNAIHQQNEPQHRFKPGEKDRIFNGVVECLEKGDEHGLTEIFSEYQDPEEKLKVWTLFNSQQRAAIKALLGSNAA